MTNKGYTILPRLVAQKPWFNEPNTLKVYVFLLVNAAFSDIEVAGYTIHKGEYVTSISKLAGQTQLTIQQTRTALIHLKATNEITVTSNKHFSIIKLNSATAASTGNKSVNTPNNKQPNKPANNRSIKEEEKCRNKKEEEGAALPPPLPSFKNSSSVNERDALVAAYGEATVSLYEDKFRKWTTEKNASNVPVYKTIAKWLAQDIGTNSGAPTAAASAQPPKNPLFASSLDIDRLMDNIMRQYKKGSSLDK